MSFERDPLNPEAFLPTTDPNIFSAIIPDPMAAQVEEINPRIHKLAKGQLIDEHGLPLPLLQRSFDNTDWGACALASGGVVLGRRINHEADESEVEGLTFSPATPYKLSRSGQAVSVTWHASEPTLRQLGVGKWNQIYSLALNRQPADRSEAGHSLMEEVLSSAREFTLERAESILGDFEYYFPDSRLERTARIVGGLMSKLQNNY